MTEPKLTIIIAGDAGTGKSSLAHWLALQLENSFAIVASIDDGDPHSEVIGPGQFWPRLEALDDKGLHVEIQTVLTRAPEVRLSVNGFPLADQNCDRWARTFGGTCWEHMSKPLDKPSSE